MADTLLDEIKDVLYTELKLRMLHIAAVEPSVLEHHADMTWRRMETAINQKIQAEVVAARIDELKNFNGWIDRIHYQPVNDEDRWCKAAGEIMAEASYRIAALTPTNVTKESK